MPRRPVTPDEADILRSPPFRDRLRIVAVEPIEADLAHSGSSFRARSEDGRSFKLRVCRSAFAARRIAYYVRGLPEFLPRLEAREGRYLLLEMLEEHRRLGYKELLAEARVLGEWAARIHERGDELVRVPALSRRLVAARVRVRFRRDLALLARRQLLSEEVRRGAERKAAAHLRRFGLPVALELDDLHKANLMRRDRDGDLRYVDEEGVGLRPRGTGLASLLKSAMRRETLELYREGYAAASGPAESPDFPNGYVELLLLLDAVRRAAHKLREGTRLEKLPDEVAEIRAMAEREGSDLDWRFPKG